MSVSTIALRTADGEQPVKVFTPAGKPRGGVLVYMDAFGWRDELDGMAARYAEAGWLTCLPDMFYRQGTVRFPPPDGPGKLDPAMHAANSVTTLAMSIADTGALLDWAAAAHPDVQRFGAVGYCMGARHALAACVRHAETVKAAACLHGGRMVWDGPDSPHLLIPQARGGLYFAFARDDETCPPEHQALIEETIRACGARAEVEHYEAKHGWTFPTRWCHDAAAAERTSEKVLALFEREVG
jgi:carboxymethylenebutenolidase